MPHRPYVGKPACSFSSDLVPLLLPFVLPVLCCSCQLTLGSWQMMSLVWVCAAPWRMPRMTAGRWVC